MPTQFPPFDGSAPKQQKFNELPEMGIDATKRYTATMSTTLGELVMSLDPIAAPRTVNNFVFLALNHYYDGVVFHRIIKNFMCQGGDPQGTGTAARVTNLVMNCPSPINTKLVRWRWPTLAQTRTGHSSSSSVGLTVVACRRSIHCSVKL